MEKKESYQELEASRNLLQSLWQNLQIDKVNQNTLIDFLKQENKQLKEKIELLKTMEQLHRKERENQFKTTIIELSEEYHDNFEN